MTPSVDFNRKRVALNLSALTELSKTSPERSILESYTGWGGLREAIYHRETYRQLKQYLSDEDINAIKESCRSAYYTPDRLVDFVYERVQKADSNPERILEPSAGHGIFLKGCPLDWQAKEWVAIDKDRTSSRLLKALYPKATVCHQGFEDFNEKGEFDLIIGNPPYGQTKVRDECHPDLSEVSIHHYFVAKCMRLLRPKGILAMILPRYFLDAPSRHVRHLIAREGGTLIEAYRLPDDLFEDAKVTVDVVLLQKKVGHADWVETQVITEGGKRCHMNGYFFRYPDRILGEIKFIKAYGRDELSCKRKVKESKGNKEPSLNLETETKAEAEVEVEVEKETNPQPHALFSLDSDTLENWESKIQAELCRIANQKAKLSETLATLDEEAQRYQDLMASLKAHYQSWQSLSQSLARL